MKRKENLKIVFPQRFLPLFRLGFYKELSKLNTLYDFTILCPMGEDRATNIKTITPEQFAAATDHKFKWRNVKVIRYYKEYIIWQTGLIMPLLRKEYDVVMFMNKMSHLFYWLLILICKLRGIKLIFWSHGLQGNETGFKLWIKKWYLDLADVNLIYAHYSKDLLVKSGIKPDAIQIIYNSLDLSEQDEYYAKIVMEDRAELKRKYITNDYPVVIFLGRLVKRKKIEMLLKAASILKKRGFNTNILLAGDGVESAALKNLSDELQLNDSVHFLGRVEEPELVKYFYISDVSVSPGNTGLNCIHSLNYGVPVITHNDFRYQFPEVEILIENETGVFFRNNDVEDLADKIEHWLKNHSKDGMSEKLRKLVKNRYTPQVQAQCFLDGIALLQKNGDKSYNL